MDITEIKEPVEVYELAEKKYYRPLVDLLRSDEPISRWTRDALADYFEGKPVRLRRRGAPRKKDWFMNKVFTSWALQDYKRIAGRLKKRKSFHGQADVLADAICRRYGLELQPFLNKKARAQKNRFPH